MAVEPEPGRSSGWPQIAAALVAVVAFAASVVGMATSLVPPPLSDLLYRSLQLFVLEGSALEPFVPLNGWLEAARFLAPVATGLVVVVALRGLLGDRLRRRRIAASTGHAIVCGDGGAALALARNMRESGRAVVLVGSVAAADAPGGGGVPLVPGDPREPATLVAAGIAGARDLYACASRSAVNAAVALAAGRLRSDTGRRLSTFAQVRSDDLVEALRVRRLAVAQPETVTMDFFSLDDIAARLLLSRHPLPPGRTPVIVGFGPLGQAVLRAVLRGPGGAPQARTVLVASIAPATQISAAGARLDAASRGWEVRRGSETDGDGPVYVCLADEDDGVATGLRLGRGGDREVVVCLQRASPFAEALDSDARLKIFGVLDEACREEAIAGDSIVSRAARAIHERYRTEAAARGEVEATNPSMAPWPDLTEALRQSNVAQAEHIGVKLGAIDAGLTTVPTPAPFAFADGEIERLARMEHARWVEERTAAGFRWGPRRDGREHPDLKDWPDLSHESREKDVDAVRHLPELLASEGLYIQREPAG